MEYLRNLEASVDVDSDVERLLKSEEEIDSDSDSDEGNSGSQRRQYKMAKRIQVDCWDDYDFNYRFRMSKTTFVRVLEMVRSDLEHINPRYEYIRYHFIAAY